MRCRSQTRADQTRAWASTSQARRGVNRTPGQTGMYIEAGGLVGMKVEQTGGTRIEEEMVQIDFSEKDPQ